MAKKNVFTVTLDSTGEQKSASVKIMVPSIVDGFWTSDKEGKKRIKNAKLGETVYFHVKTTGISNGQELILKLYEQDKNIFMIDWVDPDDNKFPEEEVVKKGIVNNNKVTIQLVLQENWEVMIKDDSDNAFSLDTTLELYWQVKYNGISKNLPNRDSLYLRVAFSDKTLYFKTPTPNHNLPEFISYNGDPMLLMQYAKDFTIDQLKEKGVKFGKEFINKKISNIALVKLEKGYMVDNMGKVYKGKRLIREYKKMYSNSGQLFENVKKGKNFGYNHGNGLVTTKGVSQYDYFSKTGKRVKALGLLKKVGSVFDVFDLVKFTMDESDTSMPSGMFGPLAPLAELAGVLVQEQIAETDMWLEDIVQLEVDEAKLKGLEATRKAINSWNHNKEFKWDLLPISKETANKLLAGEFNTFEELYEFNIEKDLSGNPPQLLYREILNNNRNEYIYVIETIFINE